MIFCPVKVFNRIFPDVSRESSEIETKGKQSGCNIIYSRRQSQFSVDCAQVYKGLFSGILVLAFTTVSLIMFFELVTYENLKKIAILQVIPIDILYNLDI